MEENNVTPLTRKPPSIGVRTEVGAWWQDPNGARHLYVAKQWIRRDEIFELLSGHPSHQQGKCIIVFRGGKTVECHESLDTVAKMEGK